MDNSALSLRKLPTVLGVSQPFLSQIRSGKWPLLEELKKKVEGLGASHSLIIDTQSGQYPPPKELYKKKRPPFRMAFSKLKIVWRECEGVEPTYPARHEA